MQLLPRTHLALRILVYVARHAGEPVVVQRIAADLNIPRQYAAKLVHELVRAHFLQSVRGRLGGILLAKPAPTIRIGDVVQSVESLRERASYHDSKGAEIEAFVDECLQMFIEVLNLQTVQDLLPRTKRSTKPPSVKKGTRPRLTKFNAHQ
jgi:Rrf2 family protein